MPKENPNKPGPVRKTIEKLQQIVDSWRLMPTEMWANAVDSLRFRQLVSTEQEAKAARLCDLFAGEVLDFFRHDSPASLLQPLGPTESQISALDFLLQSVEDGSLRDTGMRRRMRAGTPLVVKNYTAGHFSLPKGLTDENWRRAFEARKCVDFIVCWPLSPDIVPNFSIFGDMSGRHAAVMNFMALPKLIETQEMAHQLLDPSFNQLEPKVEFEVYDAGKRIILRRDRPQYNTFQYFLIGSNGEDTQREYWIYGYNDATRRDYR